MFIIVLRKLKIFLRILCILVCNIENKILISFEIIMNLNIYKNYVIDNKSVAIHINNFILRINHYHFNNEKYSSKLNIMVFKNYIF